MSLGERLATRRHELGWTQIQVAQAAGLTPSAISLFESNKRKPSFEALWKLAEALQVSMDYFTEAPFTPLDVAADPRLKAIADGFRLLDEKGRDELVELTLQLLSRRAGGYEEPDFGADPRQAARAVLERCGIRFAPVDPFLIATLLGLTTRMVDAAASDWEGRLEQQHKPPLLLLARTGRLMENRLRYTAAHLLGHFLLQHHSQRSYRCRRFQAGANEEAPEREANAFAAELLAPLSILRLLEPDARPNKRPDPSLDQALSVAGRCKVSVPVGLLQYVRASLHPCAGLLTEGDVIREVAVSESFPYRVRERAPAGALCLTTLAQKGVQWREAAGSEWLADGGEAMLREEAYHYNAGAGQSVTLLSLVPVPLWHRPADLQAFAVPT